MGHSKPPRPGTFPYQIKWLINHYASRTVDDEGFKEKLSSLLASFPMSDESSSACIGKYLFEQEKYGPLSIDDLKHIVNDLISEVDSAISHRLKIWIQETYG